MKLDLQKTQNITGKKKKKKKKERRKSFTGSKLKHR